MSDEREVPPLPTFHSNVPLPPKLEVKGNLSNNWKRWRQLWDSFEIVSRTKDQSGKYRVATFITCVGPDALDIYNGLPFENEEAKTNMDTILNLMERHCLGETNVIYERYIYLLY
ncbi:hypothetical protein SNE40_002510 [Patella caerulea]|uniref:Uncharacterized protein n=1 Tax=Patella caerulea TaxID=87958 RepID=A0AAN8K8K3_PATCE